MTDPLPHPQFHCAAAHNDGLRNGARRAISGDLCATDFSDRTRQFRVAVLETASQHDGLTRCIDRGAGRRDTDRRLGVCPRYGRSLRSNFCSRRMLVVVAEHSQDGQTSRTGREERLDYDALAASSNSSTASRLF